jgi:1,4-alpha-glucan branching enzyme
MGDEFGQVREWAHDTSLEWHVLQYPVHAGMQEWVAQLNRVHREQPALHELDIDPAGFEWVDCNDSAGSTMSMLRKGRAERERVLIVCNFTPVPREGFRVGVPSLGYWRELLNSDGKEYGGSGVGNEGGVEAKDEPVHGRPYSLNLTLPPLGVLFLKGPS